MDARTLGQLLRDSVARHGSQLAYVTINKDGRKDLTYTQLYERVRGFAGALVELGVNRGDRVVILGENSVEWMVTDLACQCLGAVVVPIYPTLPADQASYIASNSGAQIAICSGPDQAKKLSAVEDIKTVLFKGDDSLDILAAESPMTHEALEASIDATQPTDVFTIIYTSGTTGVPKGAMLAHRSFNHVADCAARYIQISQTDRFLSFLPMSHVFERVLQYVAINVGACTCVSRSLMSLPNELKTFQPTVMVAVPRFLENMRSRVLESVAKEKPIRQRIFQLGLSQGLAKAKGKFAPLSAITDHLVAAKIRARLGGHMRFLISGGAALAPEIAEFYMAMGLTVLQGYGLTETSGGTCVNRPERNKYWTVGEPLDMELKLASDGEILLRGPGIMVGYYNMPKETSEAIDADGWFHTGDIGKMDGNHLMITDRKKDIIVLGNGKNVAPQQIENLLKTSDFIQEAVVFGDHMDHCVALIVPAFEAVRHKLGLGEDVVLSKDEKAVQLIRQEVDRLNKQVASFEMVKRHAILDQAFSIESGEITPTLKVKRRVVGEKHKALIESLG